MNILVSSADDEEKWCDELSRRLPAARIYRGMAPVACQYALLWQPPAGLLAGNNGSELRAAFSLGAGVDSLLGVVPAGVPVIRVEDAGMALQMEEYALYVVLESFRRFRFYRAEQGAGRWTPQPAYARSEFNIAVLGTGILGSAVIRAVGNLGFPVCGWSRTGNTGSPEAALTEVLEQSHVVILLLPLTAKTQGIMNRKRMTEMPPGSVLANLARGPLVVEEHLREALDCGHIDHAYLDVFNDEPLPPGHPLWQHPRVSVTPHIAAQTPVDTAVQQIVEKIVQMEAGLPVSGVIDPLAGY